MHDETAPRLRILAVDDDALVLMSVAGMLEDLGHDVTEAYSAAEALDFVREKPFDLVVTDHSMPKMTGSELAAAIRAEKPDLRVVLATGYADLPPGGNNQLPRLAKPFTQNDLRQMLVRVFQSAA